MSQEDLRILSGVLRGMSPQAVLSLGETGLWWLPDLKGITHWQAMVSILRAVESLNSRDVRVFCLAWFYCCLAARRQLTPWKEFRVAAMATAPTGRFTLHERLASALRQPGGHAVCAMIESSGIKHACVMTADPGRETAEHDMICFCFSPSLPYFCVYPASPNSKFIAALHHLLRGNPAQQPEDYLGELRFAFSGVPEPLGDVAARRNSNAWDDPGLASMILFQTDRRVERRQPPREEPTRTPPSSVASSPSDVNVLNVLTEQMAAEIRLLENRWLPQLPMGRAAESSVLVEGSSSGR